LGETDTLGCSADTAESQHGLEVDQLVEVETAEVRKSIMHGVHDHMRHMTMATYSW
jgi:hypothetical protein